MRALDPRDRLDQLLSLYFQLLDLSLDMERNRDDFAFRQDGGKIWYVFDENLLELFIDPRDHRGRMASLHSAEWGSRKPEGAASSRSYVAQTALATTEYLFSGDLPGQERGTVYMTEWHRWEFTHRVERLQWQQVHRLRAAIGEMKERFGAVRKVLAVLDRDPDRAIALVTDRRLAADLVAYRQREPTQEALKTYLATRLSLDVLANDDVIEPAEQLRRLVTAPLRHVFSTLHRSLPSASPEEKKAIAADARRWIGRLQDHCQRHDIEIVQRDGSWEEGRDGGRQRSLGALWDDAKSLALIRWAATLKSRSALQQRIVLVTADQIVFDAYREWYSDLHFNDPAYAEPFCLRRLTQFAPALNLVSSGRVEGGDAYFELFHDLMQALEVMLLPLNLSRIASRADQAIITRMREKTALRPTQKGRIREDPAYDPLVAALSQGGVDHHRNKLDEIIDRWRELERAALGRPDEQIQNRIEMARALDSRLDSDSAAEAYERYVTDLVQVLLSGSRSFSLPLAREFVEGWRPPPPGEVVRAPIALRLLVTTPPGRFTVGEMLDRRQDEMGGKPKLDEEDWKALFADPAIVLSMAAAHCLTVRDWSNAQHFAEMALLEEMEHEIDPADGERQDRRAEIKYLYALVNRFRMGEIGPPLSGETFSRLNRYYRLALGHLNECETHHSCAETRQDLRRMRVLSERAALHLFFVSATNKWVRAAAARRVQAGRGGSRSVSDTDLLDLGVDDAAVAALKDAEADLVACLAIDTALPPIEEAGRRDFRAKLQRQYFTNIASVGIFRALWDQPSEGAPPLLRPDSPSAVRRVREIENRFGAAAHPLMRADVLGFLALGGDRGAADELARQPGIRAEPGVLKLDIAIVDAIRAHARALLDRARFSATAPSATLAE